MLAGLHKLAGHRDFRHEVPTALPPYLADTNRLGAILCAAIACALCARLPPELVTWDDVSKRPAPVAGYRIAYGGGALRFGDLRLPGGDGPFPLAVVIHGGCWRSEDDLRHISHLSSALTKTGIATWTVEYRRVGDAGGGWTGTFEDVAAGTDYTRELAKQFPIDLSRVVLIGHSAGGHLALWVAARRNLPEGSPLSSADPLVVRGVVSLAGISDLRAFSAGSAYCNASVPPLLGGTADVVPERYRQASPIELVPLRVALRLLHGALDPYVPVEQSRNFAARARSLGDDVEITVLPAIGHFDLIAPWSEAWPEVERTVVKMLGSHKTRAEPANRRLRAGQNPPDQNPLCAGRAVDHSCLRPELTMHDHGRWQKRSARRLCAREPAG